MWHVAYWMMQFPMISGDLQGYFTYCKPLQKQLIVWLAAFDICWWHVICLRQLSFLSWLELVLWVPLSSLTLLDGWPDGQPTCKKSWSTYPEILFGRTNTTGNTSKERRPSKQELKTNYTTPVHQLVQLEAVYYTLKNESLVPRFFLPYR